MSSLGISILAFILAYGLWSDSHLVLSIITAIVGIFFLGHPILLLIDYIQEMRNEDD